MKDKKDHKILTNMINTQMLIQQQNEERQKSIQKNLNYLLSKSRELRKRLPQELVSVVLVEKPFDPIYVKYLNEKYPKFFKV